jgi:hypothetical protein
MVASSGLSEVARVDVTDSMRGEESVDDMLTGIEVERA